MTTLRQRIASLALHRPDLRKHLVPLLRQAGEHKPGDVWKVESGPNKGKPRAMSPSGNAETFDKAEDAQNFAKGKGKDKGKDEGKDSKPKSPNKHDVQTVASMFSTSPKDTGKVLSDLMKKHGPDATAEDLKKGLDDIWAKDVDYADAAADIHDSGGGKKLHKLWKQIHSRST